MIVCVLVLRFQLAAAAGGHAKLVGRPVAIAPQTGGAQRIGEVSGAAQAFGVRAGMALGEALARCPQLELIAGDPVAVATAWEHALSTLEGIGTAVSSERPGLACFAADGLLGLHGGSLALLIAATRRALTLPARIGAAQTRFGALAAALGARPRRPLIVREPARAQLAPLPVALLRAREQTIGLVEQLERLGIATLGELAALPRAQVADRFGPAGAEAHRLASGEDDPPRPRQPAEALEERLELPEAASGMQLEHALDVLIDRLLARRERRGRTLRAATLAAGLASGGTWRVPVTFRESLADRERMHLALAPRLAQLPAPANALALRAERFGPPAGAQGTLLEQPGELRQARLVEAVRQARAAAGATAALRVLLLDGESNIPERRALLSPFGLAGSEPPRSRSLGPASGTAKAPARPHRAAPGTRR